MTFLLLKHGVEFRRSSERGRFVLNMLREQRAAWAALPAVAPQNPRPGTVNHYDGLRSWLLISLERGKSKAEIAKRVSELKQLPDLTPDRKQSLRRWERTLREWHELNAEIKTYSPERLLELGRLKYYEALGYQRIGRRFDAVPLFLWSADILSRFISADPMRSEIPEALLMIGDAHLQFRSVLPNRIRVDRIINLCAELYPESIWATRAMNVWRDEVRNES